VSLGVNTNLFQPREQSNLAARLGLQGRKVVVWVGSFSGWQGLETILEAAALVREQIQEVCFILVGEGPVLGSCQKLCFERGLADTVRFTGRIPYESVPDQIGCAHVCVAAFPGNRGNSGSVSSLKTVSYLACGRPVLTTQMDEMGEGIQSSGAGLAVPPDDPSGMAKGLVKLLSESPEQWRKRCNLAAQMVSQQRSWDATAARIAVVLREYSEQG